ncbi:MAG TPA: M12 family metallo-peptidase, partial [Blastocatellia bacterium]
VGAAAQDPPKSPDGIWQEISETPEMLRQQRQIKPDSYRTFRLNQQAMQRLLGQAPMEFSDATKQTKVIVTLPLPDGKFGRFRVEESPIMAPELAAKFPEIKTYSAQGLDDPAATARLDWTPAGFHAMILSATGSVYVDPYSKGDTANYISYDKRDYRKEGDAFRCFVSGDDLGPRRPFDPLAPAVVPPNGMTLRTYRLALAANVEYTQAAGGTVPLAMARMTTTMNRVNGVFEREIAIRMVMIANNNALIYTTEPDPYTNNNSGVLLNENQMNVDNVIGTANYDIGHVFTTGSGGRARLNSPCDPNNKARGTTGRPNPIGDSFDIDFVAHEFGHQFGANHTFNEDVSESCGGGARAEEAAYEPASGSTIMAYAGICTPQNLQPNSNDYFHVKSLEEMIAHITGEGNCAAQTATQNAPPVANAGASFTIPRNTPFTLTATATDANGDALTYDWEEFDLGAPAPPNNDADGQVRPIFRSYSPLTSGVRTFPSLQYILNNANVPPGTYNCGGPNCITGEVLPSIGRTMNFQATVRDNRAGGGGVNSATMQVTVVATAGPFQVTAPNTAVNWTGGGQQTVTWAVNGTTAAPINAANVKISLSTDGGLTFPIVIANSTPNDGSQTITVPNVNTMTGRIKVEAAGNIFFDISDANITIASVCATITINPPQLPNGAVNVAYNQTLTGSGGNAPYTFTLDAGSSTTTRFDAAGPVNIPDNNPAGVDLPINVSGISSSILKVTVSLQLAHTLVRELKLQLIGPDATTIDLAVNRGPDAATTGYGLACNPDASRTTFDDAAATLIADATPPYAGTFKPDQLLAAFNGKSGAAVNGQWKLHVVDNALQDTGTINCVSIFITQTQPAPGLSLAANGTLSGIPTTVGTYNFTVKATDAGNCMGTQ